MASLGFGTVAPSAMASPAAARTTTSLAGRRARRLSSTAATKIVTAAAAKQEKGLFDSIFGALYKEEQLLETDPILNKVAGKAKAAAAPAPKKAAAPEESGSGGFSLGGFFSQPKAKKG